MTLNELFSSNQATRTLDCSMTGKTGQCETGNVNGKCGGANSNATDCPSPRINVSC